MGKPTPPPLPPAAPQKDDSNLTPVPQKKVLENDPSHPAPKNPKRPRVTPQDNAIDIDFDVVKPRKRNYLWLIPTVICLLLIGGGVYAWYYVKDKEEKERRERREEEEAREAAEKAVADSIAEAKRLQEQEETERLNFTTPALTFLSLKGHVQSVHYNAENLEDEIWLDLFTMLFNGITVNFDYDGNFVNLPANMKRWNIPTVSYGAGNMVTNVTYHYDDYDDSYSLNWNGNYLSSITNNTEYSNLSETHSGGEMSSPDTISFRFRNNDDERAEITFNITYSDRDEYGNWRTAYVSASGTHTYTTSEWDPFYEEYVKRTVNENLNYNYTVKRFINFYGNQ